MSLAHLSGGNVPQHSAREAGNKMPPSLTAQPQTLFFTVPSFHGAVKTKSEKKARPKSLLPAVGLEGNTEGEESVQGSIYGCGAGELRAWHSSLVSLWTSSLLRSPWDRGVRASLGCVSGPLSSWTGSSQSSQSKQSQPQQSWNHFN